MVGLTYIINLQVTFHSRRDSGPSGRGPGPAHANAFRFDRVYHLAGQQVRAPIYIIIIVIIIIIVGI